MELRFVKLSRSNGTHHHGTLCLVKDDCGRVRTHVILDSNREESQQSADEHSDCDSRQLMQRPSPVAYKIHSPDLWRCSFIQAMVTAVFPQKTGYARLAEVDIALQCSNHKWTPAIAIHDAVALLHVGAL